MQKGIIIVMEEKMHGAIGIVTEFDPFHHGHEYLIRTLKSTYPEKKIICVMSGCFTQRGEPACFTPIARAEAAVKGGADLVLSMPPAYSLSAANYFALGAIGILASTGIVTHLGFGSETGDISALQKTAEISSTPVFEQMVSEQMTAGVAYGTACCRAFSELSGAEFGSNDILGMEYIKAIGKLQINMLPVTIVRRGAGHNSGEKSEFPSASYIRSLLCEGLPISQLPLPAYVKQIITDETEAERSPIIQAKLDGVVLGILQNKTLRGDINPPDGNGGLCDLILNRSHGVSSVSELVESCVRKCYPVSKVRRCLWQIVLNITPELQHKAPSYLRVLAAGKDGFALLNEIRNRVSIPVIQRTVDLKNMDEQGKNEIFAESIYSIGLNKRWVPECFSPFYEKQSE